MGREEGRKEEGKGGRERVKDGGRESEGWRKGGRREGGRKEEGGGGREEGGRRDGMY